MNALVKLNLEENSIFGLDKNELKDYFLKGRNYCNINLPPYYSFDDLLLSLYNKLDGKNLTDFYSPLENGKPNNPKNYDDVNLKLLTNKNNNLSWRKLELINPAIYVSLISKIIEDSNWKIIFERFIEFSKNNNIECFSLPIKSDTEDSDNLEQLSRWVIFEKESVKKSLNFRYIFKTDIEDCYGSIYTHAIAWAIHTKSVAKEMKFRKKKKPIGNIIDNHLQDMNHGQTNSIPQGSVLTDFIAEIVLGYIDLELSDKLEEIKLIDQYHILRFRDDYRIFVNNQQDGDTIIKLLSEVLIEMGMRLNPYKTISSQDIITDSIKKDKIYLINNSIDTSNIDNKEKLYKYLLRIHSLSKKYQNSGSVQTELVKLNKCLDDIDLTGEDSLEVEVFISIVTDIAYSSPKTFSTSSMIISKLVDNLNIFAQNSIINSIYKKFTTISYSTLFDIWLKRIDITLDTPQDVDFANNILCQVVYEDVLANIWNLNWLKGDILTAFDEGKVIDEEIRDTLTPVISEDEIDIFHY